ncbi:MAG: class I SAM-dependent methyltransferase [Planctomycetota bacterium]|jgi:hypothetical protein
MPRANQTKSRKKKDKDKKRKKAGGRTAATSDRHELYELSVQEPESEVELIEQVWREQRNRPCRHIREDFCGTAVVCSEWVKRHAANTAIGVDLDRSVLAWSNDRQDSRLSAEERGRLTLLEGDVLKVLTDPVDSVLAMNFSYYLLRTREEMRAYFERARAALVDDGLFLLDAYGGSDAFLELEEEREIEGFTYVWDQHSYDPISGEAENFIHFRFPDGTEMHKAFEYPWRLWTLPEIQELLREAGFADVKIYWEGTDDDGEGDGEWSEATKGDADQGWVAYIVAMK